jgi:hypothetical protein
MYSTKELLQATSEELTSHDSMREDGPRGSFDKYSLYTASQPVSCSFYYITVLIKKNSDNFNGNNCHSRALALLEVVVAVAVATILQTSAILVLAPLLAAAAGASTIPSQMG